MAPPRKKPRKSTDMEPTKPATQPQQQSIETDEVQAVPPTDAAIPAPAAAKDPDATTTKTQKQQEKSQRTLFIRSLPPTTPTENLTALFSRSHPVRHATAVLDPSSGQCKGYGFVTFADADDAAAARAEFHAFALAGELGDDPAAPVHTGDDEETAKRKKRRLRVDVAEPRQRAKTSKFGADAVELIDEDGGEGAGPVGKKRKRGTEVTGEERLKRDLETGSKVIVRNLPWSVKSGEQLGKYFEKWGKLKGAVVPKKPGGLLQGFGFVTFKSRNAAEKAIKEGSELEVDGRRVAVDWAVKRDAWKEMAESGTGDASAEGPVQLTEDASSDVDAPMDEGEPMEEDEDSDSEMIASEDLDEDQAERETDATSDEPDDMDGQEEDRSSTLFVRNLPFTCTDEDLEDVFRLFGSVRYARVVLDTMTERSRGTGFVCFYSAEDADACLRSAPRYTAPAQLSDKKPATNVLSVLQDETLDPTGKYTMDGRVLHVSRAVAKSEASRLTAQGVAQRFNRDKDKRRLYLLGEGTINSKSALWEKLSPTERQMREASAKQRKTIIESNPSLQISLTRLSVRNIPRSVTSKDLKQLARDAVVGFAKDVKEGKRSRLSKEEVNRGGEEMREAERERKANKHGIVRQAKIVFEGREGGKVEEKTGAGRSRGYGFIEYHTHRNALMGLRWLNGFMVDYKALQRVKEKGKAATTETEERKKRLIVEFAIENQQVVQRRKEREGKARERASKGGDDREVADGKKGGRVMKGKDVRGKDRKGSKRGRGEVAGGGEPEQAPEDERLAKRQRIIQKKRMMRRAKKNGKEWKA